MCNLILVNERSVFFASPLILSVLLYINMGNKEFDDLKDTIKDFTNSFFSLTSDSMLEAKDLSLGWLMNDDDSNFSQAIKKVLNRNNEMWEFPGFYESHSKARNNWGSFYFSNPFGLVSYKAPSVRKYNECLDKQGLSVWDGNGYWRCLFPNLAISNNVLNYKREHLPDEVLTRDDFETEMKSRNLSMNDGQFDFGSKGHYFKTFEDLMNWKSVMYNNIKLERQKIQQEQQARVTSYSEPNQWAKDKSQGDSAESKKVISTNIESTYSSDQEKNETLFKQVKTEYYSDGTSNTHTITKIKPFGESEWTSVDDIKDGDTKGWFWK